MSSNSSPLMSLFSKNTDLGAILASGGAFLPLQASGNDPIGESTKREALDPLNIFGLNNLKVEPMAPVSSTNSPIVAGDEAAAKARREFLQKQALLSSRNSTTKTNSLGTASDVLQTNRKTLLGG